MNLDLYQAKARETAIYPAAVNGLFNVWLNPPTDGIDKTSRLLRLWYVGLGLAGEICELITIVDEGTLNIEKIVRELGDCAWYCAAIADELGMPLSEVAKRGVLPPQGMAGARLLTRLIKQYGLVANTLKRMLRDKDGGLTKEAEENLIKATGSMVATIRILAGFYEVGFDRMLSINVEKLADRKERGVLKGEGDKR